jgi:dihydrofolate synthase/folylpolyglutamate synthase
MIFGAMADKQYEEMISILKPHTQQVIFTRPQNNRAKDPAELQRLVPASHAIATVPEAIEFARMHAPPDATILICGSLYLIGEARPLVV